VRGPEGPRGSARDRNQVASLVAPWPLPALVTQTRTADSELDDDVLHPVADVAEGQAFVVVGERRVAARAALSALLRTFGLAKNEVIRSGNSHTDRLLGIRHFDLLGRLVGGELTDPFVKTRFSSTCSVGKKHIVLNLV